MRKLNNYIRTYRKRIGLSQEEMAYLLASRGGAKISRYENFKHEPTLRTAIAYAVLFGVPFSELFAGVLEEVEKRVAYRMRSLLEKFAATPAGRRSEAARRAIIVAHLEKVLNNINNHD